MTSAHIPDPFALVMGSHRGKNMEPHIIKASKALDDGLFYQALSLLGASNDFHANSLREQLSTRLAHYLVAEYEATGFHVGAACGALKRQSSRLAHAQNNIVHVLVEPVWFNRVGYNTGKDRLALCGKEFQAASQGMLEEWFDPGRSDEPCLACKKKAIQEQTPEVSQDTYQYHSITQEGRELIIEDVKSALGRTFGKAESIEEHLHETVKYTLADFFARRVGQDPLSAIENAQYPPSLTGYTFTVDEGLLTEELMQCFPTRPKISESEFTPLISDEIAYNCEQALMKALATNY